MALRELGVPTREFRVGDFAAEPFPELVVVTTAELAEEEPELVEAMQAGLERGYELAAEEPEEALDELLGAVEGLERGTQEAQMEALVEADAFSAGVAPGSLDPERYENWERLRQRERHRDPLIGSSATCMLSTSPKSCARSTPYCRDRASRAARAGGSAGTAGARTPGGPTSA